MKMLKILNAENYIKMSRKKSIKRKKEKPEKYTEKSKHTINKFHKYNWQMSEVKWNSVHILMECTPQLNFFAGK